MKITTKSLLYARVLTSQSQLDCVTIGWWDAAREARIMEESGIAVRHVESISLVLGSISGKDDGFVDEYVSRTFLIERSGTVMIGRMPIVILSRTASSPYPVRHSVSWILPSDAPKKWPALALQTDPGFSGIPDGAEMLVRLECCASDYSEVKEEELTQYALAQTMQMVRDVIESRSR